VKCAIVHGKYLYGIRNVRNNSILILLMRLMPRIYYYSVIRKQENLQRKYVPFKMRERIKASAFKHPDAHIFGLRIKLFSVTRCFTNNIMLNCLPQRAEISHKETLFPEFSIARSKDRLIRLLG